MPMTTAPAFAVRLKKIVIPPTHCASPIASIKIDSRQTSVTMPQANTATPKTFRPGFEDGVDTVTHATNEATIPGVTRG